MRLGLFGGTFDPIHLGHLILAETCREACGLDRVWFVVAGEPPHKRERRTDVDDRIEMVKIAIAGNASFELSDIETKRPGPHYSVETLEQVRIERPEDELFFLIGGDSLTELASWRSPERIVELARLVVVNRPGWIPPTELADTRLVSAIYQYVEIPPIGIASRDIRDRAAAGSTIRYRVPRGVEEYIRLRKLYQKT